jgi:hypothetical protein
VSNYKYIGRELDLFAKAINWKDYWIKSIENYVKGDVLEVGAGVGNNSKRIAGLKKTSLTCLEPDPILAKQLADAMKSLTHTANCQTRVGTTRDLTGHQPYNTILYIDVLEHIDDDVEELDRASSLLDANGYLVVLAPAFNWLYSPFDSAIGHCRRYSRRSLRKIAPNHLTEIKICYLDAFGFFLSMGNRLLFRQNLPTPSQIKMWDQWVVRVSRVMDPAIGNCFGRTILGIWQKR